MLQNLTTSDAAECQRAAEATPNCTHFVWLSSAVRLQCVLKTGPVMRQDAVNADGQSCGLVRSECLLFVKYICHCE